MEFTMFNRRCNRLGGMSGSQSQTWTAFLWPTYGRQLHGSYTAATAPDLAITAQDLAIMAPPDLAISIRYSG